MYVSWKVLSLVAKGCIVQKDCVKGKTRTCDQQNYYGPEAARTAQPLNHEIDIGFCVFHLPYILPQGHLDLCDNAPHLISNKLQASKLSKSNCRSKTMLKIFLWVFQQQYGGRCTSVSPQA